MRRGVPSWGVSLGPLGQFGLLLGENCAPVWIYRAGSRDVSGNSHVEWSVAGAEDSGLGGGDSDTVVKGCKKTFLSVNPVKSSYIKLLPGRRWAFSVTIFLS